MVTHHKLGENYTVLEGVGGPFNESVILDGAQAALAASYGFFFIADRKYKVIGVEAIWAVAGGAGATVTVERLQGTEAKGAGDVLLTAAIATNGTANTRNTGTLVTTNVVELSAGDRLGLVNAGTLTALSQLCVTVRFQAID
ncbi:MAG: hypothetical protein AABY07_03280 [Nanoarchaeota archaeon]